MPGLAGLAGTGLPLRNSQEILRTIKQVGLINGTSYQYKSLHADEVVILNTLTGLLNTTLDQPGSDPTGNAFLFLEGEIFNLDELKGYLSEHWSHSPCDILLALFLERGYEFIKLVNGEFNIVIYQKTEKRLNVFCDHIASMPMYYLEQDGFLFFGSEKKYILSLLKNSPTIDPVGLLQIVAHRHNLDDRTFLDGVKRLIPGTRLTYQHGRLELTRCQLLTFRVPRRSPRVDDLLDEWTDQLKEATRLRLQGKDRILISLSAGLDSRAIACAIPRDFRPISSRTRGVDGSLETTLAANIAERLCFDHHQEYPETTSYSDVIPKIAWRTECETHFTNALSISGHAAAKMHSDHITGGWLGDASSGAHIFVDCLLPRSRRKFVEHAYHRNLIYTADSLRDVFSRDFLQQTFPELQEAFFESFECLDESDNLHLYEMWDLYQRQRRQTTSSMSVDSYLFEKIRPFYDKEYLNFTLTLPTNLRFGQSLYQSMIHRLGPEIREIPSSNNQLRLRRSRLGNLGNKGLTLAHRAITRRIRRIKPAYRNRIERLATEDPGLAMRQDPSARRLIEQFLDSNDCDPWVFNRHGIRTMLEQHYLGANDHSHLLGYVATFSAGLPYFLNRTLHCPPEAEPLRQVDR